MEPNFVVSTTKKRTEDFTPILGKTKNLQEQQQQQQQQQTISPNYSESAIKFFPFMLLPNTFLVYIFLFYDFPPRKLPILL